MPLEEVAASQLDRIHESGKIPARFVLLRRGEVVLDRERDVTGGGLEFLVDDVLHEVGDEPFDEFLHISSGRLTTTPHDGGASVEKLTLMARRQRVTAPKVEVVFLEYSDSQSGPPQILSTQRFGPEAQSPILDRLQERMEGRHPR